MEMDNASTSTGTPSSTSCGSIVEYDEEETCGFRVPCTYSGRQKTFLFKRLQRFAKPHWALALFSCVGFFQGFVVSGLINIVLTTIQKRFGFSSAEAGFILSSYNIASCIVIPVISYFGGRGNKPVWIGWGMALMGLGCLIFASPHFFAEGYQVTNISNINQTVCFDMDAQELIPPNINWAKYVFIFAHALNGIGTAALLTLGMTYLDENVEQKVSSIYHGIYFAIAAAIGPAAGYVIGGYLLQIFTIIGQSSGITSEDSAWVGAWWLGFVICGSLLLLLSVLITLFPPTMLASRPLDQDRSAEMHQDKMARVADKDENFGKRLKDLPKFILVLLRNPAFLLVSFANSLDFGLIAGFSAFTPKYLESMFGLTPTLAAYYLGLAVILGGAMGYIAGGLIVSKAKLTVVGMMRMCCFSTLATLGCSFIYLYSCPNMGFAGATTFYPMSSVQDTGLTSINFTSQCNEGCTCSSNIYSPVCGSDDVTYFSSCFAGCDEFVNGTYTNCTCISGNNTLTASPGKCVNQDCNGLIGFMFAIFGLLFFTVLCWTPVLQIVVRVVPFNQRSFAVGAQWVFNRAFGGIPIPIVFGKVYDLACAVWSSDDGNLGSCRLYKNDVMARYTLYLVLAHKVLTLACYILGAILYKPSQEVKKSTFKKKNNIFRTKRTLVATTSTQYFVEQGEEVP